MANYTATRDMNLEGAINGTHQFAYDNESGGPFSYSASNPTGGEALSWSGGTGKLWHLEDDGSTGYFIIELLTGSAPTDGQTITGGTSSATCDVDGSVTATGPMVSGDDLTIDDGALVTCTETPSILMGNTAVTFGELLLDGVNITSGNMINWVGEYNSQITCGALGKLTIDGDWVSIGTTDGTNSQTFDLSVTGSDYWDSSFCVDYIPMIQIETGRRINYQNSSGTVPEVGDWVALASSPDSVHGKITEVNTGSSYLVVEWLIGTMATGAAIQVEKVIDSEGPLMAISWTAEVHSTLGVVKETGTYRHFGNTRANSNAFISYFSHGVGGFVFDCAYQSTTLTMGTAAGSTGGFVPPTGCDVRVPNVHFSTSNTTNYASGQTYHDGTSSFAGWYDITMALSEIDASVCNFGIVRLNFPNIYQLTLSEVGFVLGFAATNVAQYFSVKKSVVVLDPIARAHVTGFAIYATYAYNGGLVENCMAVSCEIARHRTYMGYCSDVVITDYVYTATGINSVYSSALEGIYLQFSFDCVVRNCVAVLNSSDTDYRLLHCNNGGRHLVENVRVVAKQDHGVGTANQYPIYFSSVAGATCVGFWYLYGSVFSGRFIYTSTSSNIKLRCHGRIDAKVDKSGVATKEFLQLITASDDVSVARVFQTGATRIVYAPGIGPVGLELVNCSDSYSALTTWNIITDAFVAGVHSGSVNPGSSGLYLTYTNSFGRQIIDLFKSDTRGYFGMTCKAPSQNVDNITVVSGSPSYLRNGRLKMESGDVLDVEQDYFANGHGAFTGELTTVLGSGGTWYNDEMSGTVTIEFQYDTGDGWNGSWLNARTALNWTSISGTHEFDYDNELSGPFTVGEDLSWGTAGTAGTGILSTLVDNGTTGNIDFILTSGVVPTDGLEVTGGTSSATCDVNGSVSASSVMVDGAKIKYRMTCTSDVDDISAITIDTVTTLADQAANFYPIDQNEVVVKITVIDGNKLAVQNAQVGVFRVSDNSEIMNEDTNSFGIADALFLYAEDTDVVVKVRKSETADDPRYIPFSSVQTITENGLTLTVTLRESNVLN